MSERPAGCRGRAACRVVLRAMLLLSLVCAPALARVHKVKQKPKPDPGPQLVIIDTDIGDDIDDAFALALAERSPELKMLGVTTAFGDTRARAAIAMRFLNSTGAKDVPVYIGVPTPPKTTLTQGVYGFVKMNDYLNASDSGPDFILDQIRKYPHQITLIAIGPQTNLAAAFDKDPATFRKLKRIVMMGGSVDRGYQGPDGPGRPQPEWNIVCDVAAARKVFASGVPIYMMPLDSTMLKFDPAKLKAFLAPQTPLIQNLRSLYYLWSADGKQTLPTLFDPMAVAYAVDPALCPTTPLYLTIDDNGMTVRSKGKPNVNACLKSDSGKFFDFYLSRTADTTGR
jgi:purine nucleosidase